MSYISEMNVPAVLGKVYPNGEFVIWKPRTTKDSPLADMPKVPGVIDYIGALIDAEFPEGHYAAEYVNPLGLSIDPILNPREAGLSRLKLQKGLNGVTGYGRRMIRNGCWLLEHKYSVEQLSFLTLTLPSLTLAEGRVIQDGWSDVMQRFKNSFAKECRKQGLPLDYTYCVEIQELRSRSAGWPVLHVHMVFVGRNSKRGAWRISTSAIDSMWQKALEGVLRATVDVSSACRVEKIKKSAEGYMSKYLSKGHSSLEEWKEEGLVDFLPSHWWGMSSGLRAQIRGLTYYGERVGLDLEVALSNPSNLEYVRTIDVVWNGYSITVGSYGRLKARPAELLKNMWDRVDEIPF